MATATQIITAALRHLGKIYSGASPTAAELSDGLSDLNDLLDSWSTEELMVYYRLNENFTLSGAQSYTIGSGGDFNTTRPTKILSAYVRNGGIDYPVTVLRDRQQYDEIGDKSTTGTPEVLYYEPTLATGTVFVYPVGSASDTLYLNTLAQFTAFPDVTTDVDLPPGYKRALQYNLAVDIAPGYETEPSAVVASRAMSTKADIKRINRQLPIMSYSAAIPTQNTYDIETG